MDIKWQQCLTNVRHNSSNYDICNFNNGFLLTVDAPYYNTDSVYSLDIYVKYIDSLGNMIWEKNYGGSLPDLPEKILPINNDYFYLIGTSSSSDGDVLCEIDSESNDIWIAKINAEGEIIWQTCYGCGSWDDPRAAIVTPDNGLLIMTRIWDGGGDVSQYYGSYDNWILKLDSTGVMEWETTLGTPGLENGHKLFYTSFNTYIALCAVGGNGGVSECTLMNDPSVGKDVWLVELDLEGNIINQECYGGSLHDLSMDIVETEVGYTILSLTESNDQDVSGNHGEDDFWLLGINYNREVLWQKCLGGYSYDTPMFLTLREDGTYVVIGYTYSHYGDVSGNHSNGNLPDIWVVNTDSVGDVIWQHCIGTKGMDWFAGGNTVAKKDDYTYTIMSTTGGPDDYDGDVQCENWPPDPPGTTYYYPWVFQIKDCSHFAPAQPQQPTGKDTLCVNTENITTYSTVHANNAWYYEWQLQPEEAGILSQDSLTTTIHWSTTYEGPATLKVRSTNDCGESTWSDSLIIQTYTCLGTNENNFEDKLRIYPNPATSRLIVEMDSNSPKLYTIEVYNSFGSQIYSVKTANNNTMINVSGWNSGIYVVNVLSENNTYSKKVLVR